MENIQNVLENWNIGDIGDIQQIYKSAWSVGENYMIKKAAINEATKNIAVSRTLRDNGIPAVKHVPTLSGKDFFVSGEECFLVMERIPGNHISDLYSKDYADIAYKCGMLIGRLHIALAECQQIINPSRNSLYKEMTGWIKTFYERHDFPYIEKDEFEVLCGLLGEYDRTLPTQLIHRDLHFGNLLFENDTLTGYIDFDLSQINYKIFDLCYFCLSQLMEAMGNDEKQDKWFLFVQNVFAGYFITNQLTQEESESVVCIMKCIELLFVAFSEENNDKVSAKSAAGMYSFICRNKNKLLQSVV